MTRPSRASSGMLMALGAAVLFAVNDNVSKVALLNGVSSLELVSVRSAGTALILLGITALRSPAALRVGRRELGFLALYGVTGIAMVQWLYFVAIQRMPVGIALLFEYTAPLMVALWERFVQKQPVRSRLWLGLACALAGLAMVAQFWKGMTLDPIGLISAVGAGAALACYYLMGEHGQRERDPISLMAFTFGFSAVLWAIVSPWWTFPFARLVHEVDLPGALPGQTPLWLLVLWIIVLGSVVPFLLVLLAVGRLGPARVGPRRPTARSTNRNGTTLPSTMIHRTSSHSGVCPGSAPGRSTSWTSRANGNVHHGETIAQRTAEKPKVKAINEIGSRSRWPCSPIR